MGWQLSLKGTRAVGAVDMRRFLPAGPDEAVGVAVQAAGLLHGPYQPGRQ